MIFIDIPPSRGLTLILAAGDRRRLQQSKPEHAVLEHRLDAESLQRGRQGPCKAMAPAYEAVAAELEPAYRFLKVDTEVEQALAARYIIRSIPMLMVFHKGSIVAQRAGAVDRNTLRAWLAQAALAD